MRNAIPRQLSDSIRAIVEPIAERQGCDVVAVEVLGSPGGRCIVRVSLDRPGGATIQDCTKVSRVLSPTLDAEDLIAGAYDLEVSTPGIERPLQREADFRYFQGCEVRIKLYGDGRRRLRARLRGCDDGVVHVETDQGPTDIPLAQIERAHLVLDLDQYARLGQGLHPIEGDPS